MSDRPEAEVTGNAAISASAEKRISEYDRLSRQQLVNDRLRAAQQFNAQYDPDVGYRQRMASFEELRRTGELTERAVTEFTRQESQARLEASNNAVDGMIAGLQRYANEAGNAGQQSSQFMQRSLSSMEDVLVQFVMTGKASFSEFANAVISDLVRIMIQQVVMVTITKAIKSALGESEGGGIIGGIFGGISKLLGGGGGGGGGGGMLSGTGGIYHSGGIVGSTAVPTRQVPMSIFMGARRYHSGGVVLGADEVPIIAQRGEAVLTKEQQSALRGGGVVVNITNNTPAKVTAQGGQTAAGMPKVDVLIEAIDGHIAEGISRQNSATYGAIAGTFGVSAAPRSGA